VGMAGDQVYPVDAQKVDEHGRIRDDNDGIARSHRSPSLGAGRFRQGDQLRSWNAEQFAEIE
jgi:hypothetical protein